jgi:Tol biopolymer transport system component
LKPANVMITTEDRVKVLDFGLAKLLDPLPPEGCGLTVTAAPVATIAGEILGSAAYMSPEQAAGRPVDHRSDIFSIGVLLYEMATGVRPFQGESGISILSAIIKDEPAPLTRLRPGISRDLERIVSECLAKAPPKRLQTAAELRARLEALTPRSPSRRPHASATALLVLAAVLLAMGAAYLFFQRRAVAVQELTFARVTDDRGVESSPGLSPDSREIVYAGTAESGEAGLYLRRVDGGAAVRLTEEASDNAPAFSPDGQWIAFGSFRDNSPGIFVMDRQGQSVRRVTNGGSDPFWTPDGREVVYGAESGRTPEIRQAPSELWAVNVESGRRRRIAAADGVQPRVSPNGRLVAFWALPVTAAGNEFAAANRDIWVQPLAGGRRLQITTGESTDWNPAWAPDGRTLFFSSDRGGAMNFWAVAVDALTGRPSGEPLAMTVPSVYASHMSVGGDGTIAYAAFDYSTSVRSIGFDPIAGALKGAATDIVTGQRAWLHPDVSPDGRFLALRSWKAQEDIWIVAVDGSGLRPVTNDPPRDRGPRWTPEGSLLFYSARGGNYEFWTIRPDGSGSRRLTHGDYTLNDPVPSRDGRRIGGSNPNTGEQYIFDAHDWSKPPQRLPAPPSKAPVYLRDWSADGTRVASADTSGVLWVFDVAAGSWDRIGAGSWPRWLPDGRRLLAIERSRVTLVDAVTKEARELYREPGRAIGSVVLAPDGQRLYFTSSITESDIWTIRFNR